METLRDIIFVLACFSWTQGYPDCRVRNFPIVENFDIRGHLGLWFEQDVFRFPDQPLRQTSAVDLVTAITPTIISYFEIHRDTMSGECTEEVLVGRQIDPSRAILNLTDLISPEPQTFTGTIADTDNTGFFVAFNCIEERSDGTCKIPNVVTFTRTPRKTPSDVRNIDRVLDRLCIDRKFIRSSRVGKPCPRPRQPFRQCLGRKKSFYGRKH